MHSLIELPTTDFTLNESKKLRSEELTQQNTVLPVKLFTYSPNVLELGLDDGPGSCKLDDQRNFTYSPYSSERLATRLRASSHAGKTFGNLRARVSAI